mgnify:CR=1 FL=1
MVKLRKEKILVSLVVIILITLVFGSIASLATTPIIANTGTGNTAGAVNNTTDNTTNNVVNNTGSISATVGNSATNNSANNTNTNNTSNSAKNNTSTNSSTLPYAGTDSSVIFIVIALVASALYAYKKVSDYNV